MILGSEKYKSVGVFPSKLFGLIIRIAPLLMLIFAVLYCKGTLSPNVNILVIQASSIGIEENLKEEPEKSTVKTLEVTEVMEEKLVFTYEEAYLLAKLAKAEGEGESLVGKALVIRTALNRVASADFPDTVKAVIFETDGEVWQFSPLQDGRYFEVEPDEECFAALELVQSGWDDSKGALYFRAKTEETNWHSSSLEYLFDCGNQSFYK